MTIPEILDSFPDFARDIKLNVQSVLAQTELTEQQTWTNAVACALASRNETLSQAIVAEAATKLSPAQLQSAKSAFAIMQMNNIFYRFRHMVGKDDYANIPARLRMQTIRTHGGDPVDFELACLAVSTINGCEACVRSHEAVVRDKGVSAEAVTASVRIASTLHAAASVIEAAKL